MTTKKGILQSASICFTIQDPACGCSLTTCRLTGLFNFDVQWYCSHQKCRQIRSLSQLMLLWYLINSTSSRYFLLRILSMSIVRTLCLQLTLLQFMNIRYVAKVVLCLLFHVSALGSSSGCFSWYYMLWVLWWHTKLPKIVQNNALCHRVCGTEIEFYVSDHRSQSAIMAKFRAFMLNPDLFRTPFWTFSGPLACLNR